MTYTDTYPQPWKSGKLDQYVDKWGMYSRECTSYCAFKLSQNGYDIVHGPLTWNAEYWDDRARALGVKVDKTPAVGSIAQWEFRHVAYVEAVYSDGTIDITEYNYNCKGDFGQRRIKASSVSNFIHFKDVAPATIPVPEAPVVPTTPTGNYDVTVTTPLRLRVRTAPNTTSATAKNTGTTVDGLLAKGDVVKGCQVVRGELIDGYNGWYRSPKGRYFTSTYTNRPVNV
jgi:surface antigen